MGKVQNMQLFLLLIVINLSCTNNNSSISLNKDSVKYSFDSFSSIEEIKFEKFAPWLYNEPRNIFITDSNLIVTHIRKGCNQWVRIINRIEGSVVDSFLSFGKGPDEALGISCSGFRSNSNFWAFDMTKKELWQFDDILNRSRVTKKRIDLDFYRVDFINDSTIIGNACYRTNYKIDQYDLNNNKKLNGFGSLESLPESMPLQVKKQLTFSDIRVKPDDTKFAVAYHSFDLLEIYSSDGKLLVAINGPINSSPQFEIGKGEHGPFTITGRESIFCFANIYTTNKYIYASFSGKSLFNKEGIAEGELCEKLFVFDWEGNPIKYFNLNDKITTFCIDERNNWIYSYSYNTGQLVKGKILI